MHITYSVEKDRDLIGIDMDKEKRILIHYNRRKTVTGVAVFFLFGFIILCSGIPRLSAPYGHPYGRRRLERLCRTCRILYRHPDRCILPEKRVLPQTPFLKLSALFLNVCASEI